MPVSLPASIPWEEADPPCTLLPATLPPISFSRSTHQLTTWAPMGSRSRWPAKALRESSERRAVMVISRWFLVLFLPSRFFQIPLKTKHFKKYYYYQPIVMMTLPVTDLLHEVRFESMACQFLFILVWRVLWWVKFWKRKLKTFWAMWWTCPYYKHLFCFVTLLWNFSAFDKVGVSHLKWISKSWNSKNSTPPLVPLGPFSCPFRVMMHLQVIEKNFSLLSQCLARPLVPRHGKRHGKTPSTRHATPPAARAAQPLLSLSTQLPTMPPCLWCCVASCRGSSQALRLALEAAGRVERERRRTRRRVSRKIMAVCTEINKFVCHTHQLKRKKQFFLSIHCIL